MRRALGGLCVVSAFVLPFVVVPMLAARYTDAIAWSYGMQGPTITIGTPLLVLMIQGLRLWNGD